MSRTLRVLCCANYRLELEAAIAAEGWGDVTVGAFEARCGRPPVSWSALAPLAGGEDADVLVLGGACLSALAIPPERRATVRLQRRAQCFELVANPAQIGEALERNAYLVTPGWLGAWREHLAALGFEGAEAAALFREFARELVLLDTGVSPEAGARLPELARTLALPASRTPVGLEPARAVLARAVAEWRLEGERRAAAERDFAHARERADLVATLDFVGRLVLLGGEAEAVAAIEDVFRMLFAPRRLHVAHVEGGALDPATPADVRAELEALSGEWGWTASGTGFLVKVSFAGEPLAVVLLDGLAFPRYRERYLELALSVARVSGLAIRNARTYRRLAAAEEALRRSERGLRLAQAIAHVGHWELDARSGTLSWSDETARIFGLAPGAAAPTLERFLGVIHPDDRARVEGALRRAREEGRLDVEFRVVLADGAERIVHGLAEGVLLGPDRQRLLAGAAREARPGASGPVELLGVVQDVTERKQLERRLEQEARTDALTGCANRKAFLARAEQELTRVRRHGGELSLLLLDVDRFKGINDRHGHAAGDEALRALARICRGTLRAQDVVGRIGGEEFAVLLPATGAGIAAEVAERLRRALSAAEVRVPDGPPLRITASLGVAALRGDDARLDAVLERADRALYEAKAAGRDRVVVALGGTEGAPEAGVPARPRPPPPA